MKPIDYFWTLATALRRYIVSDAEFYHALSHYWTIAYSETVSRESFQEIAKIFIKCS